MNATNYGDRSEGEMQFFELFEQELRGRMQETGVVVHLSYNRDAVLDLQATGKTASEVADVVMNELTSCEKDIAEGNTLPHQYDN